VCLCVDIVPFSLDNLNTFSSVDTRRCRRLFILFSFQRIVKVSRLRVLLPHMRVRVCVYCSVQAGECVKCDERSWEEVLMWRCIFSIVVYI
jgi:hypothetical protein